MSDTTPGRRARREPARDAAGGPPGETSRRRPLYVAGLVAALWCIGIGLAVLTTITLIGWIAAPKTAFGNGLSGVFRAAVNLWLIAHHAGFSYGQGRFGLLPLGLLVLPGALLYRGGGWMIRLGGPPERPRGAVARVAVAQAVPYAALSGLLALAATSDDLRPSVWQALVGCFLVAVTAGGLGAARAVVAAQVAAEGRGRRVRSGLGALLRLLPERPRSLIIGVAGATGVLLASGAVLVAVALAVNMGGADDLYEVLAPGMVGGVLLLMLELAFLPNAVIWGMAYAIGPGFSVGAGTSVSPTGVFLDAVPAFPPLAALPEPGPAPALSLLALAAPFVAGAVGGVLTMRSLPSPVAEGAPLWGFLSGALTGVVAALLSALSGGPLGGGRMATVGPSPWQVGLLAALEVGISAAIAAWVANWMLLRRPARAKREAPRRKAPKGRPARSKRPAARPAAVPLSAPVPGDHEAAAPAPPAPHAPGPVLFEEAEPVLAPRRPRRRVDPLPDIVAEHTEPERPEPEPEPERPEPAPQPSREGMIVLEGRIEPEPERRERPARPAPPPREGSGRTERRGGAIYVLRDESDQDG